MINERKFIHDRSIVGRLEMRFSGEVYPDAPVLDTEVKIDSGTLCWISWPEKDQFLKELNEVITKYSI